MIKQVCRRIEENNLEAPMLQDSGAPAFLSQAGAKEASCHTRAESYVDSCTINGSCSGHYGKRKPLITASAEAEGGKVKGTALM